MNPDRASSAARRYLLGEASEEESSAIEREYFDDEAAVDRITAVEEDLVEDYLADRLTVAERSHFERHYLAAPHHRTRVETIRRLSSIAGSGQRQPRGALPVISRLSPRLSYRWLAMAASVVIGVGAVWMLVPRRHEQQTLSENRPASAPKTPELRAPEPRANQPVSTSQSAVHVFALSLSPVSVRSANDSPTLVIPAGADLVALRLEGEASRATISRARAVIRTVAGDEVWRGPAMTATDLPSSVVARVEVPAAQLRVDDYVVVLFGIDPAGVEQERDRYFLRVRSR